MGTSFIKRFHQLRLEKEKAIAKQRRQPNPKAPIAVVAKFELTIALPKTPSLQRWTEVSKYIADDSEILELIEQKVKSLFGEQYADRFDTRFDVWATMNEIDTDTIKRIKPGKRSTKQPSDSHSCGSIYR